VSEEAQELLAREGFDRTLGARPLRRAIQRLIEDPLSEALLHNEFHEGDVIEVIVEDGRVGFRVAGALVAAGDQLTSAQ
jgi:ATP-dependent Clp protease ATP-binding subunit ClpC